MTNDDRKTATILAALRFYQRCLLNGPSAFENYAESDIATNGGTIKPLDNEEIDALCENLNQNHDIPPDWLPRPILNERVIAIIDAINDDQTTAPDPEPMDAATEAPWHYVTQALAALRSYDREEGSGDEAHKAITDATILLASAAKMQDHARDNQRFRDAVTRHWFPAFPADHIKMDAYAPIKPAPDGAMVQVWLYVSNEEAGIDA